MPNNHAIVVGIDNYEFTKPLKHASKDAKAVEDFLVQEAGFSKVFLFSDNSPDVKGKTTRPHRNNLLRVLRKICAEPFLEAGDSFWFFFSGHGIRDANADYLIPIDGDPEDVLNTAIPVEEITKTLRKSGAGNLFLILDACRSEGPDADSKGAGVGKATSRIASSTGIISMFSCSPDERSYEISEVEHGSFTQALLEGLHLNSRNRCSSVAQLDKYLRNRVPEINSEYGKSSQSPYVSIEPLWKAHLLMFPELASDEDIKALENDALNAELENDLERASQAWWQLVRSSKVDMQAAERAIERVTRKKTLPAAKDFTRFSEDGKGSNAFGSKNKEQEKKTVGYRSDGQADGLQIGGDEAQSNKKISSASRKVLIVGLIDTVESRLEIDAEIREIQNSISESRNRDSFTIENRSVSTIEDTRRALLESKPEIVHFCGSPLDGGIVNYSDKDDVRLVSSEQLGEIFQILEKKPSCVLLSRCYSKVQSIAIAKSIDYVIGLSKALEISHSLKFVTGFYDSLGSGESIEFSYEIGCNYIELANTKSFINPTLKRKSKERSVRKILILAANPINTSRIRLDRELREIKRIIQRRAKKRDFFKLEEVLAVRAEDISRKMLDFRPQIVHFCGHGVGDDGLVVEGDTGHSEIISNSALSQLFKLFSDDVECVIFSSCYSDFQARAVAQHIDYVIGMSREISDSSAIHFSTGFYEAIGDGNSIESAYNVGCSFIHKEGGDQTTPVLVQDPNLSINSPLNRITSTGNIALVSIDSSIPQADNNASR